jgi:3-phenylpropionate/trans-cinnamate dioxygenase ferredoxin reductase subunit
MPAESTYVIVGASLTGAKAAETLREEGFDGNIVLLGEEHERPTNGLRCPRGTCSARRRKSSIYVHEEGWYAENGVDLRLGVRATALDPGAKRVSLDDGGTVAYDRLLLATGASPRRLNAPGGDLDGVLYLRRVGDSERLQAALRGGGQVVTVGGGWIGLEVTAAARQAYCEVTVVEPEPVALHRQLGPELGGVFADLHKEHGVVFRTRESVTELRGSGGQVTGAVTSSGRCFLRTSWWSVSGQSLPPAWPPTQAWTSATASSWTPGCTRRRTCSRPGTSPTPSIRCMASTSEWSTGPTR